MKTKLYILSLICVCLCACTSEEPQADMWVVTFYDLCPREGSPGKIQFLKWCETHEDILLYSIPPRNLPSFSYESALSLKWKKYTTSEAEARQMVNEFNSIVRYEESATYRKYNPKYKGPWRIIFQEVFDGVHNDSDAFLKWYDAHREGLYVDFFLVKDGNSFNLEHPDKEKALTYYNKSMAGNLYWGMEIRKASEKEIKNMVNQFQSFSIIDGENFDAFIADYAPIDE